MVDCSSKSLLLFLSVEKLMCNITIVFLLIIFISELKVVSSIILTNVTLLNTEVYIFHNNVNIMHKVPN